MRPARYERLQRMVSEFGTAGDAAALEVLGMVRTLLPDPARDLRRGMVETTRPVGARRLRTLFDELGVPTRLEEVHGGVRRTFTVHRLHFRPDVAAAAIGAPLLEPGALRAVRLDVPSGRALWRGVLLASELQRRRSPGIALAVRDGEMATLLVEVAAALGITSAHREQPGWRVVIADPVDVERLLDQVLTPGSLLSA